PESISNQKTNEGLKEICQRVSSLQVSASKTRTQGGMKLTTNYQKWQIVSTHTGRRTFATNAYLQGVPTVTIMAVTGHKTEKAFLKYIKVTPKEHAKIMAGIWAKNKMRAV
ncbi:MAG: site-specific integrase, partial [Rhabdochlamydiaceae bacterium]